MRIETIFHVEGFDNERAFIEAEIEKNMHGKLDAYLRRHANDGDKVRVEFWLERVQRGSVEDRKKGMFDGKLRITIIDQFYQSERQNFVKLDDLINHLFTHIKDQLAK